MAGTIKKEITQAARNMNASEFKKFVLDLLTFKCSHGHTGLSHYNCYLKEKGEVERTGYIDIETSNLHGNFGIMLSYCILDGSTDKILGRHITPKELRAKEKGKPTLDKYIVKDCIEDMLKFDRLVVHYGGDMRFDLPFLRTRAIKWGLEFPEYGTLKLTDTYPMAKRKLRLNSNRQNVITELYEGISDKTRVIGDLWTQAIQGDLKALKEIYRHNEIDVRELKKNHEKLSPYVRQTNTSI